MVVTLASSKRKRQKVLQRIHFNISLLSIHFQNTVDNNVCLFFKITFMGMQHLR